MGYLNCRQEFCDYFCFHIAQVGNVLQSQALLSYWTFVMSNYVTVSYLVGPMT